MEGSSQQIIVFNDHKNLTYFQSARVLNRRQARWAQFLTRFDFVILYRPGMQQGKADALSQRSYMELQPGEAAFESQKKILLGPDRLRVMAIHTINTPGDSRLLDSIREQIATDAFAQEVLSHIIPHRASSSQSKNPRLDYTQFNWHDGLLFRQTLLYVPDGPSRLKVVQQCHDTPMAGHFGIHKTFELISR